MFSKGGWGGQDWLKVLRSLSMGDYMDIWTLQEFTWNLIEIHFRSIEKSSTTKLIWTQRHTLALRRTRVNTPRSKKICCRMLSAFWTWDLWAKFNSIWIIEWPDSKEAPKNQLSWTKRSRGQSEPGQGADWAEQQKQRMMSLCERFVWSAGDWRPGGETRSGDRAGITVERGESTVLLLQARGSKAETTILFYTGFRTLKLFHLANSYSTE